VEVILTLVAGGQPFPRILVADAGAGFRTSPFQIVLDEDDCILCGGNLLQAVNLRGAYAGSFPIYTLPVQLPALGFYENLGAVGAPSVPPGFDGIAAFSFLNRFTDGNFGDPGQFGLEC
jgi:hypothetical protein